MEADYADEEVWYRAVVIKLGGYDGLGRTRDDDAASVESKRARARRIREWASGLPAGAAKVAYLAVVESVESSLATFENDQAFEQRARAVELPTPPAELMTCEGT